MSICRKEWKKGATALRCALALGLGAPLLGGCAASHVGSAWQCPLEQGQPCVSVAGADPAGAGAQQPGTMGRNTAPVPASATPLYRTPRVSEGRSDDTAAQPSRAGCRGGCRPFAWLRRLGRHGREASEEAGAGDTETGNGDESEPLAVPPGDTSTLDGLRTPEVIGRIWIASYVDSLGVYHEASWVRVVFEPAGWKHP